MYDINNRIFNMTELDLIDFGTKMINVIFENKSMINI